jgi:hypothetical protein
MKNFLVLMFLTYGCSQLSTKKEVAPSQADLVTVDAALNQAQMSYLRGCVEAFKHIRMPSPFQLCRDWAVNHRKELNLIMESEPLNKETNENI